MGHPTRYLDTEIGNLGELNRVVRFRENRLSEIQSDFGAIDVEGRHKLNVVNVVAAEIYVHQSRNEILRRCVSVKLNALNKGRRAITDANDGDANFFGPIPSREPSSFRFNIHSSI